MAAHLLWHPVMTSDDVIATDGHPSTVASLHCHRVTLITARLAFRSGSINRSYVPLDGP
jgi:hypothetical protein